MSGHVTILQAIAERRRLHAVYNRVAMTLAPHILYTRHGEMYLDAVALEKNGAPPREKKLGTFKVAGLNDLALADEVFEVEELYQPWADKYRGETLFAIDG